MTENHSEKLTVRNGKVDDPTTQQLLSLQLFVGII